MRINTGTKPFYSVLTVRSAFRVSDIDIRYTVKNIIFGLIRNNHVTDC